jgi:hypothetical protein
MLGDIAAAMRDVKRLHLRRALLHAHELPLLLIAAGIGPLA